MQKNTIAALGPKGTNGHQAAVLAQALLKGRGCEVSEILFQQRNEEILKQVAASGCFGIVPIENATAGLVREVVDYWLLESESKRRADLFVIGEIYLPVTHNLLVHPSVTVVEQLSGVMSHPQALAQCSGFLKKRGISLQLPAKSTADAAEQIAADLNMMNTGAIASVFAGETYGLKTLFFNIEDHPGNMTRFHVLGPEPVEPTGNDRTAVIFQLPNKFGVLSTVVEAIASQKVNMSSIHSIPLGTMNDYAFYVELDCHMDTEVGRAIRNRLQLHTVDPIILGSYPRSIL